MVRRYLFIALGLFLFLAASALLHGASAPDPSGTHTGTAADVAGLKIDQLKGAGAMSQLAALADEVGHNKIAINFVWTLIAGFLVMFMQAGFAAVETGFCRAKNAAEIMMMNF